jgi:hypothetical protein
MANITFTVQMPWYSNSTSLIYSAGFLRHSKWQGQYYEIGLSIMPHFSSEPLNTIDDTKYRKEYAKSIYGAYGGYYLALYPILRPGLIFGSVLRKNEIYSSTDDVTYKLSDYSKTFIDYYAAFEIQSGIFSFIVSNFGIGGGLNVQF